MRTVLNGFLIGRYRRFALMFLMEAQCYTGACKNSAASNKIRTTLENKEAGNLMAYPQKKNHDEGSDGDLSFEEENVHKICNDNVEPGKQHTRPSFTLRDITMEAGATQSITLEVVNQVEGYIIKSVSVTKNTTTSYVRPFGLDELKNKFIPPSGLTFTLMPNQSLKPDTYFLKLVVGKRGMGSKATEQLVQCTITLNNQRSKLHTQIQNQDTLTNRIQYSDAQTMTETSIHHAVQQEDHKNEAEEPIMVNPTKFTEDPVGPTTGSAQLLREGLNSPITCQRFKVGEENSNINMIRSKIGESINIFYHTDDDRNDYVVKSVQMIKQGGQNSSNKKLFGLDQIKNKPFEKCINILPDIKTPGVFQLIVKIKRPGNKLLVSKCDVTFYK